MENLKLQSFWKCKMVPKVMELDDVTIFFYEHMNLGLKLIYEEK
jgi:hypothetical protein